MSHMDVTKLLLLFSPLTCLVWAYQLHKEQQKESKTTDAHKKRASRKTLVGIEDFEILKPINKGAFGKVFLVRKRGTEELYALKLLRKTDLIHKNMVAHALTEKNILAKMDNPFIIKLHYSFQTKDDLCLVMDFAIGGDCGCLLKNIGCLDENTARLYTAELVLAVEYLHKSGIVHRDIKPENLLIDKNGHIKLTDFGLSSEVYFSSFSAGNSIDVNLKTSTGGLYVGTPDYMAPEMIKRKHWKGSEKDWWSVGVVLYEFLCGFPPFNSTTPQQIFDNIINRTIMWPSTPDEMSSEACDIIDKFLTLDPETRLGAKGAKEVKCHPFFQGVDWESLLTKPLSVPTSFVPNPVSKQDTGYFHPPQIQLKFARQHTPQSIAVATLDGSGKYSPCLRQRKGKRNSVHLDPLDLFDSNNEIDFPDI